MSQRAQTLPSILGNKTQI